MFNFLNKKIGKMTGVLVIAIMAAMSLSAQSNSGSITGVVHDQNGGAVANASVTVTNTGTNEKRTVQTDGDGRYEVPALPTGRYTVEATGSGFQAQKVS